MGGWTRGCGFQFESPCMTDCSSSSESTGPLAASSSSRGALASIAASVWAVRLSSER